jgi:hypothetical protein
MAKLAKNSTQNFVFLHLTNLKDLKKDPWFALQLGQTQIIKDKME